MSTPNTGNKANGIKDVAGMGSASVAQYHAVNNVIAAVALAGVDTPEAFISQ
ncbi:hypothetical protein NBRC116583_38230 [Arenicella sp. 4NH20-0111]